MAIIIPGLESKYTFNGLTLNDKALTSRYRLLEVDGFSDADIRDSREANPSRHGETASDAFYGGKTITLSGRIEATTLTDLRTMQQNLQTAFNGLVELPMTITNPFDSSKNVTINVRKSAPIAMREIQSNLNMRREFLITLRASDPRLYGVTPVLTSVIPSNTLTSYDQFNQSAGNLVTKTPDIGGAWAAYLAGGTDIQVDGAGIATRATTDDTVRIVYISSSNIGNTIAQLDWKLSGTFYGWASQQPAFIVRATSSGDFLNAGVSYDSSSNPIISLSKRISSAWTQIGTGIISPLVNTWYTIKIEVLTSGGGTAKVWFYPRGTPSVSPLISVVDANLASGILSSGKVGIYDSGTVAGMSRSYDNISAYVPGSTANQVTINNSGNFETKPKIRFNGNMTDPVLKNLTTNQQVNIIGNIPVSEWIEIDLARNTMVNQSGVSVFNRLGLETTDFSFIAGNNLLELDTSSYTGSPDVDITHYPAYL